MRVLVPFLVITGAAAVAFWRTAYPTITWWDSSNYSLAAATLGVTSSPGSLLLTLLGWVVTRFPWSGAPAYQLNLLAGALAAITAGVVFLVALRLLRHTGEERVGDRGGAAIAMGAGAGALAFAFSTTLWEHAVKFTPYVLTAVFTALILWTMIRWWQDANRAGAWRWLALLGFLFGLDFSVHRTNALLIPGAVAWVAMLQPRALRRWESWLVGAAGLAIGLLVQLLIIPMAAYTQSPLNMFEPSNWQRFWDYVSLAQSGGGFLVQLWPRNSAFWSVQVADFTRVLADNYFHRGTPALLFGLLPAFAAGFGLFALWRRDRRLGAAFTTVLFLQASMTVLYFNIPAGYFRSLDRHYLPVLVTVAVAMAYGTGVAARRVAEWSEQRRWTAVAAGIATLALLPIVQLAGNWSAHDASERYFTRDFVTNALETLPPRAIYFTVGDNDTFPVWYLQAVEGVRPDVRVVNLSLANASWYVGQLASRDPTFPVSRRDHGEHRAALGADTAAPAVVIPVARTAEQLGLPPGAIVPQSMTVRPRPRFGTRFLPADAVLLDIVRTNAWRDPLCFAATGGRDGLGWLAPYGRMEGLHWCVLPVADVAVDRDLLRANLLQRHQYRGYADPSVDIDDTSRNIGSLYFSALGVLLDAEMARGETDRCRDHARRLFAALPPARLGLSAAARDSIESRCGSL